MIAVDAALVAQSTGLRLRIDGTDNVLTCRVDGNAAQLFSTLRYSGQFLRALRTIVPTLVRTGLRIDVVAGNRHVGSFGSGVNQNALGRLLRLPYTRIGST